MIDLFRRTKLLPLVVKPITTMLQATLRARLALPWYVQPLTRGIISSRVLDIVWYGLILLGIAYATWAVVQYAGGALSSTDVLEAVANGGLTLPRVAILMAIATVIWVPVGVSPSVSVPNWPRQSNHWPNFSQRFPRTCCSRSQCI